MRSWDREGLAAGQLLGADEGRGRISLGAPRGRGPATPGQWPNWLQTSFGGHGAAGTVLGAVSGSLPPTEPGLRDPRRGSVQGTGRGGAVQCPRGGRGGWDTLHAQPLLRARPRQVEGWGLQLSGICRCSVDCRAEVGAEQGRPWVCSSDRQGGASGVLRAGEPLTFSETRLPCLCGEGKKPYGAGRVTRGLHKDPQLGASWGREATIPAATPGLGAPRAHTQSGGRSRLGPEARTSSGPGKVDQ